MNRLLGEETQVANKDMKQKPQGNKRKSKQKLPFHQQICKGLPAP